ncbi:MAG: hypothetical protein O8C58_03335 [Candidatus Methanoperedens sp.]|nr:hypothetical protein [Candidatus Methanoperedens sp.]HLE86170.1 hypothetical protein [Candidatus Brocadiaceae bacterium]
MVEEITIWDIPTKVKEANDIIFNHEDNEYQMYHKMFINIPSDAKMTQFDDVDDITYIHFPVMVLTLYKTAAPHITIYNEGLR